MDRTAGLYVVLTVALLALGCGAGGGSDAGPADGSGLEDVGCSPQCLGRQCGPDGCGGFCGTCLPGQSCNPVIGKCQGGCIPDCSGKECGDNGCDGTCGECPQAAPFCVQGKCEVDCVPDCSGKECGSDGCEGNCGKCPVDTECTDGLCLCANGQGPCDGVCCEVGSACFHDACCVLQCAGKDCGDDGCGGQCGTCPEAAPFCVAGQCDTVCVPACDGLECGDDGCGDLCGNCPQVAPYCVAGKCQIDCPPDCTGKDCGDDGCGGSCGTCGEHPNSFCAAAGTCDCAPACDGLTCGADGCGGSCGACPQDQICTAGQCTEVCAKPCEGIECGPGDCGAWCGDCEGEQVCTSAGACVDECVPDCTDKTCGDDGCNGSCGACPEETPHCQDDGTCGTLCLPDCEGKECGDDGCGDVCGTCEPGLNCTLLGQCGSSCLTCPAPTPCLSLGFESGTLAQWAVAGNAAVITSLGETNPLEGDHMLKVVTGLPNQGLTGGVVSFQTCVPADTDWFRFSWRFYSEEFHEWCGSQYQDYFKATVRNKDGADVVFSLQIDDLCKPDACFGCGTAFVGLDPSDVQLDQGDTHVTPWREAYLPVGGLVKPTGTVLDVVIEVGDSGDGIYQTLVLVDDGAFLTGDEVPPDACLWCAEPTPHCVEVADQWQCVQCFSDFHCPGDCVCVPQDHTCQDPDTGQACTGTETCEDGCTPGGASPCCGQGQICVDLIALLLGDPGSPDALEGYCTCSEGDQCLDQKPCTETAQICNLPLIGDMVCQGGMLPPGIPAWVCFDPADLMGGIIPPPG